MSPDQQIHRRRRLAGALVGALAFHMLLGLLPFPRFSGSWGVRGGAAGGSARGQQRFLAAALHGTEVAVRTPTPPTSVAAAKPPEAAPEEPDAEISLEETPRQVPPAPLAAADRPSDGASQAASAGASGDPNEGASPGDASHDQGEPGGGFVPTGPIEMDVQPRFWVYPEVPQKVLRKHKIKNEDVILKVLVGTDGLVRDVRVLRAIPKCDECTRNAVDAARRQRYEAYMLDGRLVEVWTTFKFTFRSGQ
jgi:outer membrane biosynthesis protein TonB